MELSKLSDVEINELLSRTYKDLADIKSERMLRNLAHGEKALPEIRVKVKEFFGHDVEAILEPDEYDGTIWLVVLLNSEEQPPSKNYDAEEDLFYDQYWTNSPHHARMYMTTRWI